MPLTNAEKQAAHRARRATYVKALEDALAPFAACCEQIDEAEDGEEWAKFRLLIKDYRRARDVLR